MELTDALILAGVGLVSGVCGGLLGIGGSVVMIPGMVLLFGADQQHLYQATAMIVNFFIVGPAVLRHVQMQATLRPIVRLMIPSAIVGVVAGVLLSELPVFRGSGQGWLQIGFAVFLGYVFVYNLNRLRSNTRLPKMEERHAAASSRWISIGVVGVPMGLLGGLLGIGGGLYAVPAQQLGLRVPLPNAIANSAATMLWSSIVGAIFKNAWLGRHGASWGESLVMAACLIPTAMLGSYAAAARVHRWPVRVIRVAFAALLLYCAVRLFLAGWQQLR